MIESLTSNGVLHDLENINPNDTSIEEIAHSLSMQCRYNGHTRRFYSVAEHCVLLVLKAEEKGLSEEVQKQLLLHDASEAYLGDVIRGLKSKLPEFIKLEEKVSKLIFKKYNVPFYEPESIIHKMDLDICRSEMTQLMAMDMYPDLVAWSQDRMDDYHTQSWTPQEASIEFLLQARRLNIGE